MTRSKSNGILSVLFALLLSAGALAFVLVPAVGAQGSTTGGTINTHVANVSITVASHAFAFSPASITVVLGVNNTVVWTNNDNTTHTVTADDNSFTGNVSPQNTFTHTFTAAGVYQYHCSIHPYMKASVTVLGGPSTSTSSSTSSPASSSSGGGIPEFPFAGIAVVVVTIVVLASYMVLRQTRRG